MAMRNDTAITLRWGQMPARLSADLPFPVEVTAHHTACDGSAEKADINGEVGIRVLRCLTVVDENFAGCELGKWKVTCETHYEFGFEPDISATGHPSMFLKGGNDSNFGMVITDIMQQPKGQGGVYEDESEHEQPVEQPPFKPARVSFYVRTDSPNSDAGHFILGETNEVNRRVAQFQFTKDGNMGLLGSGGSSFGSVPYKPFTWYRIDLTFDWDNKKVNFYVNCKLEEKGIPFRRNGSSYIGACALGNRDRCTTWFDSFRFITEEEVLSNRVTMTGGVAKGWCLPVGCEDELWLHAALERPADQGRRSLSGPALVDETSEGAFMRWGPFTALGGREVVHRLTLNEDALGAFASLLGDEESADVAFDVEGETILAHRCILAARCETFKAMFSSGMAESTAVSGEGGDRHVRRVRIREVPARIFRYMLEFIYSGAIGVDPKDAMEVLALADQYMLPDLKLLCGFALRQLISVETVCNIIQAADRYDCDSSELKAECLAFILANYEKVVQSTYFSELQSSPHLLLQIHRAVAPNLKAPRPTGANSPPVAHHTRKRARESGAVGE